MRIQALLTIVVLGWGNLAQAQTAALITQMVIQEQDAVFNQFIAAFRRSYRNRV
jgi:hypothetical protein